MILCVFTNHLLHTGTVLGARDRDENVRDWAELRVLGPWLRPQYWESSLFTADPDVFPSSHPAALTSMGCAGFSTGSSTSGFLGCKGYIKEDELPWDRLPLKGVSSPRGSCQNSHLMPSFYFLQKLVPRVFCPDILYFLSTSGHLHGCEWPSAWVKGH